MSSSSATAADAGPSPGTAVALPKPVLVTNGDEVEVLIRSARATVANLTLELRAVSHEASKAEQDLGDVDVADASRREAAAELLRSTLAQRVARRRAALAAEVDRVRDEATGRVRDARAEAAAAVAAARQDMLYALVERADTEPPAPPVLRIITDDEHPGGPDTGMRWDPRVPIEGSVLGRAATQEEARTPAAAAPPMPVEPPREPHLVSPSAAAPALPPMVARAGPSRNLLLSFVYLDVLLPLVAGLIVIVVLLAWVG